MFVTKSIPAEHKDLIHEVSYDFHGSRMATCSSDQYVKVVKMIYNLKWHIIAQPLTSHSSSPTFTLCFSFTRSTWE